MLGTLAGGWIGSRVGLLSITWDLGKFLLEGPVIFTTIANEQTVLVANDFVGDRVGLFAVQHEAELATLIIYIGVVTVKDHGVTERPAEIIEEIAPRHNFVVDVHQAWISVVHMDAAERRSVLGAGRNLLIILRTLEGLLLTIYKDCHVSVVMGFVISSANKAHKSDDQKAQNRAANDRANHGFPTEQRKIIRYRIVHTSNDILSTRRHANMPDVQPTVTIYSSPTCAFCHMAKEYFKDHGVEFTEKDITTDAEAYKFVVEEVGQAVTPIITINDTVIVGFDRPKIDDTLQDSRKDFN